MAEGQRGGGKGQGGESTERQRQDVWSFRIISHDNDEKASSISQLDSINAINGENTLD